MNEIINKRVEDWNWKNQTIWEVGISTILHNIEIWEYQTKEIDLNIEILDLSKYTFTCDDIFDFAVHYRLVEKADLSYPVILNRKWAIIDWRHRLLKAILKWDKTIKWLIITNAEII